MKVSGAVSSPAAHRLKVKGARKVNERDPSETVRLGRRGEERAGF